MSWGRRWVRKLMIAWIWCIKHTMFKIHNYAAFSMQMIHFSLLWNKRPRINYLKYLWRWKMVERKGHFELWEVLAEKNVLQIGEAFPLAQYCHQWPYISGNVSRLKKQPVVLSQTFDHFRFRLWKKFLIMILCWN